ncbi:MAG: hypothetical protein ACRDSN_02390 [Pseudonocardiaceae bacterium]
MRPDDDSDLGVEVPASGTDHTGAEPPVCAVDGCGRWPMTRGYCTTHYQRWRRTGDPGGAIAARSPQRGVCTVPGCGRPHDSHGYCKAHAARWLRTGNPGTAEIAEHVRHGPGCSVDGCGRPHMARGYCMTHYSRWQRTGAAKTERPRRLHACSTHGCWQPHYRQGLCEEHYRRSAESGGTREPLDVAACAQAYRDGASAASLARQFGYTPRTVLDALRAAGVTIRPPGRHKSTHNQ